MVDQKRAVLKYIFYNLIAEIEIETMTLIKNPIFLALGTSLAPQLVGKTPCHHFKILYGTIVQNKTIRGKDNR